MLPVFTISTIENVQRVCSFLRDQHYLCNPKRNVILVKPMFRPQDIDFHRENLKGLFKSYSYNAKVVQE